MCLTKGTICSETSQLSGGNVQSHQPHPVLTAGTQSQPGREEALMALAALMFPAPLTEGLRIPPWGHWVQSG